MGVEPDLLRGHPVEFVDQRSMALLPEEFRSASTHWAAVAALGTRRGLAQRLAHAVRRTGGGRFVEMG